MPTQLHDSRFGGNAAENYERFFVPTIGAPLAEDLVNAAALCPGDRVLDVACGTGVVARLAAECVGEAGHVAGLDINPEMLETARSVVAGSSIEWHQASAEAMPHADETFDVVMCQMGLQFVPEKIAALREILRVLTPGGRVVLNVPGPTPALMTELADALGEHVTAQAAAFIHLVFALYDADELSEMLRDAGFGDVDAKRTRRHLPLPSPEQFLWQYVNSTPLAASLAELDQSRCDAFEKDVSTRWQAYCENGGMQLDLEVTTIIGTG